MYRERRVTSSTRSAATEDENRGRPQTHEVLSLFFPHSGNHSERASHHLPEPIGDPLPASAGGIVEAAGAADEVEERGGGGDVELDGVDDFAPGTGVSSKPREAQSVFSMSPLRLWGVMAS